MNISSSTITTIIVGEEQPISTRNSTDLTTNYPSQIHDNQYRRSREHDNPQEIPVSIQRQPSYRQSQKNQLAGPESFPQRQSNVLLLDNLQPVQRLRLRLQSAPNGPPILFEEAKAKTHWDTFKAFLTRIFEVNPSSEMEQAASEAATNRNMKRIDEYFDKLVAQVEQQRRLAKDSLSSLTPRQQQEIVAFWEIFASFFKEIMEYIGQISNEIAEMAKSGYRLKEGALKSLFEELQYTFDTMFYVN